MTPAAADPIDPRCPACAGVVAVRATHCVHCGFTGEHSIALYGNSFPPLKEIVDAVDCWDSKQVRTIREAQQGLRRKFPQIRTYVESVALPEGASAATYGFWRLNTAPLGTHERAQHRSWALLLVLDVASGMASVSYGYRVGQLVVDEADWVPVLEPMAPYWEKGRRAAAVREFFVQLEKLLERVWKEEGEGDK